MADSFVLDAALRARLLRLARQRLRDRPAELAAFEGEAMRDDGGDIFGPTALVRTMNTMPFNSIKVAALLGKPGAHDAALFAVIDEWARERALPAASGAGHSKGETWTPEKIAEARAMRAGLRHAGVRDYAAKTARHFGVTPQRLRAVLGTDKLNDPFPWPTGPGKTRRR